MPDRCSESLQPGPGKASARRCEGLPHRGGSLVTVYALAVAAEDVAGTDACEPARRNRPKERMKREPLAADPQLRDRSERIPADQNLRLGPPQGNLLPEPPAPDGQELEGGAVDRPTWDDVVRHAEPLGERPARTIVAVEQLDHPGGLAGRLDALVDAVAVQRIDQPDAAVGDQRVRAAADELVDDPPETEVELVAEPDRARAQRLSTLLAQGAPALSPCCEGPSGPVPSFVAPALPHEPPNPYQGSCKTFARSCQVGQIRPSLR
jgi:hypothetical protein